MVVYENECVGCASDFGFCLGTTCPNRNVPRWYCDECGDDGDIFEFDNEELCLHCIKMRLKKVS